MLLFCSQNVFYAYASSQIVDLHLDRTILPADLNTYQIFLSKGQDPSFPFSNLIDGGDLVYSRLAGFGKNRLLVSYSSKPSILGDEDPPGMKQGIRIMDISDPQNPSFKGELASETGTVYTGRDYVYVYSHQGLEIFNTFDFNCPAKVGMIDFAMVGISSGDWIRALQVKDNIVYLLTSDSQIYFVDISQPDNLEVVSKLSIAVDEPDIELFLAGEDYLYILTDITFGPELSLYIIDIRDPKEPCLIKKHESLLKSLAFSDYGYTWADISGNYLYIMGDGFRLYDPPILWTVFKVIDLSDPLNLKKAGEKTLEGNCPSLDIECNTSHFNKFKIYGDYAYITKDQPYSAWKTPPGELNIYTSYGAGVYIVDLKDIYRPEEKLSGSSLPGVIYPIEAIPVKGTKILDFQVKDNFVYCCLMEGGIQVAEIPVQCLHLQWMDANTVSAEISMPVSPGLYNIMVEGTKGKAFMAGKVEIGQDNSLEGRSGEGRADGGEGNNGWRYGQFIRYPFGYYDYTMSFLSLIYISPSLSGSLPRPLSGSLPGSLSGSLSDSLSDSNPFFGYPFPPVSWPYVSWLCILSPYAIAPHSFSSYGLFPF